MEDKELQELFEAKRTTEANRRRQAELEAMISAKSSERRKRRLWPVWASAAAAGVALLLLSLPALYNDGIETVEVAQMQPQDIIGKTEPIILQEPTKPIKPTRAIKHINKETNVEPVVEESPVAAIEPDIAPTTVEEPAAEEPTPKPRIHRRTSTRMVDTKVHSVKKERANLRQLIADAATTNDSNTYTIKTFQLS